MPRPYTLQYFGAVKKPIYQPAMRQILSITNTFPLVVTTTYDGINPGANQYGSGLIVRLNIPFGFGMSQVNQMVAPITVINDSTFSMPIDATMFDEFIVPPADPGSFYTPAQVTPVGEITSQLNQATKNQLNQN